MLYGKSLIIKCNYKVWKYLLCDTERIQINTIVIEWLLRRDYTILILFFVHCASNNYIVKLRQALYAWYRCFPLGRMHS